MNIYLDEGDVEPDKGDRGDISENYLDLKSSNLKLSCYFYFNTAKALLEVMFLK